MIPLPLQPHALRTLSAWVALVGPQLPDSGVPEYQAKALVVLALGNYLVKTRPHPAARPQPFTLGVVGHSPFSRHLENLAKERQVKGQPIQVITMRTLNRDLLEGCDILFICESESDRLPEILSACRGLPILTVSDTRGFAQRGSMLNFFTEGGNMGVEVNLQLIHTQGLEVSSSFLSLSRAKLVASR